MTPASGYTSAVLGGQVGMKEVFQRCAASVVRRLEIRFQCDAPTSVGGRSVRWHGQGDARRRAYKMSVFVEVVVDFALGALSARFSGAIDD